MRNPDGSPSRRKISPRKRRGACDPRRRLARRGERLAALYLRLHGYRILGKNLRTPVAEVDLLARRGRTLVICEVKSWRGGREATVRFRQRRRLVRAALWLLPRHAGADWGVRIDLLRVEFSRRRWRLPRIRHVRSIADGDLAGR